MATEVGFWGKVIQTHAEDPTFTTANQAWTCRLLRCGDHFLRRSGLRRSRLRAAIKRDLGASDEPVMVVGPFRRFEYLR
jgi:hypothetical protein